MKIKFIGLVMMIFGLLGFGNVFGAEDDPIKLPSGELNPPAEFVMNRITVEGLNIHYYLEEKVDKPEVSKLTYQFITDRDGKLIDMKIRLGYETPVLDSIVKVMFDGVTRSFGNGTDIIINGPVWRNFFQTKVAPVPVQISPYTEQPRLESDVVEMMGSASTPGDYRQAVVLKLASGSILMFEERNFLVVPEIGTKFRLGYIDGKYVPVTEISNKGSVVNVVILPRPEKDKAKENSKTD